MEYKYKRWVVYETFHDYQIVDPRGNAHGIGDGVDMFFTPDGDSISPGTTEFDRELKRWLRQLVDSGEAEAAYGSVKSLGCSCSRRTRR